METSIKIYLVGAVILLGFLTLFKQKVIDFFHESKDLQQRMEDHYEVLTIVLSVFYPPIIIWAVYLYFKEQK